MIKTVQHLLSHSFKVNSSATILKGQLVVLNTSNEVVLMNEASYTWALGFSADEKTTLSAGAFGNRNYELGDDTYASGYVSIYTGPGSLLYVDTTDVLTSGATATTGTLLYADGGADAGKIHSSAGGTNVIEVARIVNDLADNSGYLDSGIPNVNVPVTDSDNPRTFVMIQMISEIT
jgi:hypothetical protein